MRSLSNLIKQGSAGIIAFATMDAYRRAVINDHTTTNSDRLIKETVDNYDKAIKSLQEQENALSTNNVETTAQVKRIAELAENANKDFSLLRQQIEKSSINSEESVKNGTDIANKSISNLMNEINKLGHKFDSSDPTNNLLNDILNSYNTIELGAIGHIFGSIFIIICIFNIAITYYSDKLLVFFNIENKYPRLAKFIQLRRKFQNYYIGWNIILAIIGLIFAIYINIIVFTNSH